MRITSITTFFLLLVAGISYGETFDDLLKAVKSRTSYELEESRIREKRFLEVSQDRGKLLLEARRELKKQKQQCDNLKTGIDNNEKELEDLETKLNRKMGDLGELFGVIRQVSGEMDSTFENSMISVHYPERSAYLQDLSERKQLPHIEDLNKMWLLILEELDESRKVVRFSSPVVQEDGTVRQQDVIRIGSYGAVSEGAFLTYSTEGNIFAKALKQPIKRYRATADNFDKQDGKDLIKIMIDPTQGQLLGMLTRKPDLQERIRQGGVIGYIILGLGCAGMFLCLIRYGYLTIVMNRIKKQSLNLDTLQTNNPLGRIAKVYRDIHKKPKDEREVLWEEAILKEVPPVEKYNTIIRLLAAISPLLGLLGTVTGMIITFQSITLFGTSDPKLMAGGISTALITTVLGLSVAIPLLFAYTFIAAKSKQIVDILEYQSIGLIAREDNA